MSFPPSGMSLSNTILLKTFGKYLLYYFSLHWQYSCNLEIICLMSVFKGSEIALEMFIKPGIIDYFPLIVHVYISALIHQWNWRSLFLNLHIKNNIYP